MADESARLRDLEWRAYLSKRRSADRREVPERTPEDMTGIALSGGGIRSAIFALGVLQALARRGLLGRLDYLSTVSGGGYIGASLTWLTSQAVLERAGEVVAKNDGPSLPKKGFGLGPSSSDTPFPYGTDDPRTATEPERSRAEAVKAEESVVTLRELERAQRDKALMLVAAQRDVEAKGLAIVQAAEAEREAAARRADALRTTAQAESEAERLRQATADKAHEIEARARRALNEAENAMSPEAMQLRIRLATLERIEAVVRESARPLEKISEIKIVHVDGLAGQAAAAGEPAASVSDQVMSSALKYKLQAPLVDALLESAGISGGDVRRDLMP